jgi:glutamate synthase domain-containing protein 3
MSGGIAYVLDTHQIFESLCNKELVGLESLSDKQEIMLVKQLIEEHYILTNSKNAHNILTNWNQCILNFVKVIPHDYKRILSKNNTH